MNIILNPYEEKLVKEAMDALIADEKNLARTIYTNSFFGAKNPGEALSPEQAFNEASRYIREQTKRFPKNNTVDGRSKE